MRWCLVLVVILGVLLAGIVKVATRRRSASAARTPSEEPPTADGDGADDGHHETPPSPPAAPRQRPRPRLPHVETSTPVRTGVAALHGHVRLPASRSPRRPGAGEDADEDIIDLADLSVVASDGARTVSARADREGRFTFHLPPGVYTLSVSTGPWAAVRKDVLARGGFDREVDLELALGATIEGRVRGAIGELVRVSVRAAGAGPLTPAVAEVSVDEDQRFAVRGLIPGHRYDVTVTGDGIRTVRLGGVLAPAADLDVRIGLRATLRGAIGVRAGEPCPIEEVVLRAAAGEAGTAGTSEAGVTDESEPGDAPDGACAFELSVPDGVAHATVIATGSGWHLEEAVQIPASGDPAPVCLNPPCGNPSDLAADVVVEISGADQVRDLMVCLRGTEPRLGGTCLGQAMGPYVFKRLPIGATMIVQAEGKACITDRRTITVQRGDNRIGVACARALGDGHDS